MLDKERERVCVCERERERGTARERRRERNTTRGNGGECEYESRPTQSIIYVPLQGIRFHKSI